MLMLLEIIFWTVIAYVVTAVSFYIFQWRFMYFPNRERVHPKDIGLDFVEEHELLAPDGNTLIAWYAPAKAGMPTILYFHGNSGSLAHRKERIHRFTRAGYGVYMMSYRRYSGSTGKPSQAWNISDGLLAYDTLIELGVTPDNIVVYGESIGTGVATPVSVGREVAALILEAPFTSTVDIAKKRYPFLPIRRYMLDRYESVNVIHRIAAPLLVIHGENDKVIPLSSAQELFDAALEPKRMKVIPGAGHTRLLRSGAWAEIQDFLKEVMDPKVLTMKRSKTSHLKRSSA